MRTRLRRSSAASACSSAGARRAADSPARQYARRHRTPCVADRRTIILWHRMTSAELLSTLGDRLKQTQLVVVANREPYIHVRQQREARGFWARLRGRRTTEEMSVDPAGQRPGHRARPGDARVGRHVGRARQRHRRSRSIRRQGPRARPARSAVVHAAARLADAGRGGRLLLRLSPTARSGRCATSPTRVRSSTRATGRPIAASIDGLPKRCSRRSVTARRSCSCRTTTSRCLPRMIKDARPDVIVCQFWHIPWPNAEAFRICPWGEEILHGLLGNDLLSFHIQAHCNNFLQTVEQDARVARRLRAFRGGARRPSDRGAGRSPISIDPELWAGPAKPADRQRGVATDSPHARARQRAHHLRRRSPRLHQGHSRSHSRVRTHARRHPEWRERVVFVQVGAPSRDHLARYRGAQPGGRRHRERGESRATAPAAGRR